jgi:iron complex transport system permease protein
MGCVCFDAGLSLRFSLRAVLVGSALSLLVMGLAVLLLGTGSLPIHAGQVLTSLFGQGDNETAAALSSACVCRGYSRQCWWARRWAWLGQSSSRSRAMLWVRPMSSALPQALQWCHRANHPVRCRPLATALAAVAGGMLTALLVLLLARRGRGGQGYRLVLVGIGMGATLSGLNQCCWSPATSTRHCSPSWLAGSLNTRTWAHVLPAALGRR